MSTLILIFAIQAATAAVLTYGAAELIKELPAAGEKRGRKTRRGRR
jgi:hypothetical protein